MGRRSNDTETRLRRWVAGRLRIDDVPQAVWSRLKPQVDEVLDPSRIEDKEDLLGLVREQLSYVREVTREMRGSAASVSTGNPAAAPEATQPFVAALAAEGSLRARAEAATPYLLKRHARNWMVEEVRRRLGAPLPPEEARELIHAAEATRYQAVHQMWDGEGYVAVDADEFPFREISALAEQLLGPWVPYDVGWWVLAGQEPRIMPIWAQVRDQVWPTLTLVVPMSAPTAAVEQHYNELRRRFDLQEWHSPAPTPSPRRLGVFRFVAERCEFEGVRLTPESFKPRIPWRDLMSLWNERLPTEHEWNYTDVRNFRRDFTETKDALFHHI